MDSGSHDEGYFVREFPGIKSYQVILEGIIHEQAGDQDNDEEAERRGKGIIYTNIGNSDKAEFKEGFAAASKEQLHYENNKNNFAEVRETDQELLSGGGRRLADQEQEECESQ